MSRLGCGACRPCHYGHPVECEGDYVSAESSTLGLYESKPQRVEAVQWTGDNFAELAAALPGKVNTDLSGLKLLAGKDGAQEWVPVPVGHWLVHPPGDLSDVWPVDPDYFAGKYDRA